MTATRSLLVLHVSDARPHAPGYQRLLDELNRAALSGVARAGWEPALVATDRVGAREILALARRADAVVIMGGEDVTPTLYDGEEHYPEGGHHVPHSDHVLLAVIRDAIERRSPLLGICRGHQLLNVACGGTLVQHMEGHRLLGDDVWVRTRLRGDSSLKPGATVWCTHHQAVAEVGDNLTVVARSTDGVIEAVAHDDAPVLGVQWHPEHPAVAALEVPSLLERVTTVVPA